MNCDICKKGSLISTNSGRALDIVCTKCGRGWHIPLISAGLSPCMIISTRPPEPREPRRIDRDPDLEEYSEHEDYDFDENELE